MGHDADWSPQVDDRRHTPWPELSTFMETEGARRSVTVISISPCVHLVVEPPEVLAIRVPARPWLDDLDPVLGGAINSRCMALRRVADSDGEWVELFVYGAHNYATAYPYLTAIADRMADEMVTMREAINHYDGLLP